MSLPPPPGRPPPLLSLALRCQLSSSTRLDGQESKRTLKDPNPWMVPGHPQSLRAQSSCLRGRGPSPQDQFVTVGHRLRTRASFAPRLRRFHGLGYQMHSRRRIQEAVRVNVRQGWQCGMYGCSCMRAVHRLRVIFREAEAQRLCSSIAQSSRIIVQAT